MATDAQSVDWYEAVKQYRVVAEIDESEPYETDQSCILLLPGRKFGLLTASGCSCWGGEAWLEEFGSFDELADSLLGPESCKQDRRYNPSLKGAEELVASARTFIEKHQLLAPLTITRQRRQIDID